VRFVKNALLNGDNSNLLPIMPVSVIDLSDSTPALTIWAT
jgi:hypothetical protein